MTQKSDVRWHQRLDNFEKALNQLSEVIELQKTRPLTSIEKQGMIKAFEFTHELAWNLMKDFFEYQGNSSIAGSRDAQREAFNRGLINDGEIWMEMIKSRNQTAHTYNEPVALNIVSKIPRYHDIFNDFLKTMKARKNG